MKIIELDLTDCGSIYEIHERIQKAFGFPEWYGRNWDAFWDLLWSECDADKVIIKGENTLSDELHPALEIMHEILDDNIEFTKKCGFDKFSYEII